MVVEGSTDGGTDWNRTPRFLTWEKKKIGRGEKLAETGWGALYMLEQIVVGGMQTCQGKRRKQT